MIVTDLAIPEVKRIEPKVFGDERGYFFELFRDSRYREAGIDCEFIQDNVSYSTVGVIRGLHAQSPNAQAKLVTVIQGAIFDVAVDIRRGSPTFGKWVAEVLSSDNHRQLFIPTGFAHGFSVVGGHAIVSYKVAGAYDPASELTIRWDDPAIAVEWNAVDPIVSGKDQAGFFLRDVPENRLPIY